nr:hypothetical protein Iba_scaffold2300CG0920 [Ipomoea batatas]
MRAAKLHQRPPQGGEKQQLRRRNPTRLCPLGIATSFLLFSGVGRMEALAGFSSDHLWGDR